MEAKYKDVIKGQTSTLNVESARFALDQHSLVSVTDIDGTIVYANDKFCEVSGYSLNELLGRKHNILNSGEKDKSYWKNMHDTVLSGAVWHDEVRNRAKDGSYYWVDTTVVPNYNENKAVIGFTSIRTDITKQKKTIEQLAFANQQVESAKFALDQHSLVSITDLEGKILYVNDLFVKISGYSEQELLGRKHNILNSGNQSRAYWQKMHGTVLSGKIWRDEVRNRAKDGSFYWVDTTIVPNFNTKNEITGFTSIRTDITEQKENIEQLDIAKKQAESANQAKEEFLANMSHEIRTPMNGVYASLQLLSRHELNSEQKEMVEQSLFSTECLLTIINDILDFSKIESGKLTLENVSFSIRNTVESVMSDLMPTIDEDKVTLSYDCREQVADYWQGDPVRTKQILLNLLSNAAKFTEQGEISVVISPLWSQQVERGLSIQVTDTGIGMSREVVENVFKRFSQADMSTTRKYGGTGLGMAITLSLIKLMEGDISVKSEAGIGTQFTVCLPLKIGNEQELSQPTKEIVLCPVLKSVTVMVADDNRINRAIVKKALMPTQASLVEVENGQQALKIGLELRPDIILMDIQMPVMDGITAFQLLRQNGFSGTVIAFTANVLKLDVEMYLEQGFDGCISKPINIDHFYQMLHKVTNL